MVDDDAQQRIDSELQDMEADLRKHVKAVPYAPELGDEPTGHSHLVLYLVAVAVVLLAVVGVYGLKFTNLTNGNIPTNMFNISNILSSAKNTIVNSSGAADLGNSIASGSGMGQYLTAPTACQAETGYSCENPTYNASYVGFTFGQNTAQYYYGDWIFVASQHAPLQSDGLPEGFTNANSVMEGPMAPGQTVEVQFPSSDYAAGGITANTQSGTELAAYVWVGYCTSQCNSPSEYAKVATLTVKAS
jgi:hypothetical protein